MNFTVSYNQPMPANLKDRRHGKVSAWREPCMKIISGDADNAMMSFEDEVQARRGQNNCIGYITAHDMNLTTRRSGRSVYIIRA